MRGSVRAWIPATAVALALVVVLGAAAYFSFGRGSGGGSPSPAASVDLHSKDAVIAAVKHYYDVEAEARKTGNADVIDAVTIGRASLASQNFHQFVAEQTAKNRRGIVDHNYFSEWSVKVTATTATASYKWWLHGHDSDAQTGQPVEADMTSTKGSYRANLAVRDSRWLMSEVQLVQDNVP